MLAGSTALGELTQRAYALIDGKGDSAGSNYSAMFRDVVGNLCKIARGIVRSSERASAGIPAVNQFADFLMLD
jgi:hypothetical protein